MKHGSVQRDLTVFKQRMLRTIGGNRTTKATTKTTTTSSPQYANDRWCDDENNKNGCNWDHTWPERILRSTSSK